jgi:hypothetical protein
MKGDLPEVKLLPGLVAPEFFSVPFQKMVVEDNPIINRTYFIHKGKILAVGESAHDNNRKV